MTTLTRALVLTALITAHPAAPAQHRDSSGPFQETGFSAGAFDQGAKVSHTFVFANRGTAPLEVKSVTPTCGCAVSDFDRVVLPGQEGRVTLTVDTTTLRGSFTKGARVEWADPAQPAVLLTISGSIRQPVEIRPHYAFLEGFPGQPRTAILEIKNNESGPLRIAAVRSDRPEITAELAEVEEGKEYRLAVSGDPHLAPGAYRGTVELVLAEAAGENLKIPVTVIQKKRVYVDRGGIVFRGHPVEGLRSPSVRLLVEKYRDPEFRVTDVRCDVPFVKVETERLPYEQEVARYELRFTLRREELPAAPFRGAVTIKTNDREFSEFRLPVMGPGRPVGRAVGRRPATVED